MSLFPWLFFFLVGFTLFCLHFLLPFSSCNIKNRSLSIFLMCFSSFPHFAVINIMGVVTVGSHIQSLKAIYINAAVFIIQFSVFI